MKYSIPIASILALLVFSACSSNKNTNEVAQIENRPQAPTKWEYLQIQRSAKFELSQWGMPDPNTYEKTTYTLYLETESLEFDNAQQLYEAVGGEGDFLNFSKVFSVLGDEGWEFVGRDTNTYGFWVNSYYWFKRPKQ